MRTVNLDGRDGPCSGVRRDKLAGHLNARLREYEEEGISSSCCAPGVVSARFAGLDGAAAAAHLAEAGVRVIPDGEQVRFVMAEDTTFEDLDYVQAAAAALL